MDKKSIYDTINQFLNDNKFGNMFGDKKKPFSRQINDEGMNECDVLFWDNNLSDTKLMNSYVWADYVYEVRFNKKSIKIKIIYYGNVKEIEIKDGWGYEGILTNWKTTSIIKDISDWINDVDYGLNDCNCKDEKPPIERRTEN